MRELDADSDDTLDQVEALQQAWVAATGADQNIAGAILINRRPGTEDEARAGVFVGATYDDGNVPEGEQEAIVEDALIPPLRDGNVAASLNAGLDRLGNSIVSGPPRTALNDFADGPGSSWLPWAGLVVAILGLLGVTVGFRGRARPTVSKEPPTTHRPDHETDPAIVTALVHKGAQPSAVPATVLALAAADAVSIEQEKEPGKFDKGTVHIRLLNRSNVRGEVQQAVWGMLAEKAEGDVVSSSGLKKVGQGAGATTVVVEARLRENGWLRDDTARPRAGLVASALVGGVVMVAGGVITAAGAPLMLVAAIPGTVVFLAGLVAAIVYSRFSVAGLDEARPWEAYRDGLKAAGKDDDASIDLDDALPDIVALGLVPVFEKRLEAATDPESGTTLRAFTLPANAAYAASPVTLNWAAFSSVFVSSSGSGSTVSGGGAGGGGGAAGST
ncbi:MAG: DUF2207 family protein [Rhodococcus sp. (in: high G+C Gram-positive bacteria)]